ncbi:hypothetical protein [Mesotoga sp. UBA6090]|uniref:hypothetical protein n=1 Tax=Mesotoga sp. UBA6090 TaxID=1946860 RepID=UPI0025D607FD|nr:hypothetical protein [Mesotoga sp. UBA6090]
MNDFADAFFDLLVKDGYLERRNQNGVMEKGPAVIIQQNEHISEMPEKILSEVH